MSGVWKIVSEAMGFLPLTLRTCLYWQIWLTDVLILYNFLLSFKKSQRWNLVFLIIGSYWQTLRNAVIVGCTMKIGNFKLRSWNKKGFIFENVITTSFAKTWTTKNEKSFSKKSTFLLVKCARKGSDETIHRRKEIGMFGNNE